IDYWTYDEEAQFDEAIQGAWAAAQEASAVAEEAYSEAVQVHGKAAAIADTSAKAASHELYAQDGNLQVTLHGTTFQWGEGDPSPDNIRPIDGVDTAWIQTGRKNLAKLEANFAQGAVMTISGDKFKVECTEDNDTVIATVAKVFLTRFFTYIISSTAQDVLFWRLFEHGTNKPAVPIRNVAHNRPFISDYTGWADIAVGLKYEGTPSDVGVGTITEGTVQLEIGSVATDYEPYNATTQDLPMLPDGEPLYEGDTVDNDWASGCDKKITINEVTNIFENPVTGGGFKRFAIETPDIVDSRKTYSALIPHLDTAFDSSAFRGWDVTGRPGYNMIFIVAPSEYTTATLKEYLIANNFAVYYRSVDFKPENELRLCRVERKMHREVLDGTENIADQNAGTENHLVTIREVPTMKDGLHLINSKCSHFPIVNIGNNNTYLGIGGYGVSIYVRDSVYNTAALLKEYLTAQYAAGTPVTVIYELATPEVYCTDARILPSMQLMPETVCGSEETEVKYHHDTKHYIDGQIAAAVALALNG
ncbi:MAG: hypothetical protein J6N18_04765, partial [Kiritimatiellae bacterium]|nr:hypothetical protein [Kiritimatiellia bacterium]